MALCLLLLPCAGRGASEWTPTRAFRIFSKSAWRALPQSAVTALAQDEDGRLWLGTLDGAASFDGRDITPLPQVPGAPRTGLVSAMAARRGGGVFVATAAGVHAFDGERWRLLASARTVVAVVQASDGGLWMADSQGALFSREGDGWRERGEVGAPVMALAADPGGGVWAATAEGAALVAGGSAAAVPGPPLPGTPGALLVAHDGRVWVATSAGTVHWTNGKGDGWHAVPSEGWRPGAFRCLAEDRRGRIWAGSVSGHVVFGNAGTAWTYWGSMQGPSMNGPFGPGVLSALGDREGSIWFGLNALGLAQWVGEGWSHRNVVMPGDPSSPPSAAFGIAAGATPGTMTVSYYNSGGLWLGPGTERLFGRADGLTEDVRAFVEPTPGTFWAGTRFGLFEKRPGGSFRQTLVLPSGFVMGLFRSPDRGGVAGSWYAATSSRGVYRHTADGWQAEEEIDAALANLHVRAMTWLENGELWIGTLRGATVFPPQGPPRSLQVEDIPELPESVNAVLAVGGEVWLGGTGGIAVRGGQGWRRMSEADGLPGPTIYSLALAPDGSVWAGGSEGVGRYRQGRWRVWDSRTGLLQEECNLNGLRVDADGSVWVATMAGLSRFDPGVPDLPAPPLRLGWDAAPPGAAGGIARLPPGERSLHLRWSAPWLGPLPVEYRVRTPWLSGGWTAASAEDRLDVENLGAGRWPVEVQARVQGTGAWSDPLALTVDVPPFWYETWIARIGLVLLLAALGYAGARVRLRSLKRHAERLEATVRERTAELAEKVELLAESERRALAASQAKSAFLASMSHELRTPLNGVLGFAQILARRPGRDAEDRHGLAVIVESGRHLLGLINDVLSLSKIEAGRAAVDAGAFDPRATVAHVVDLTRPRAEEKGLQLGVELAGDWPAAVRGDEGKLRQILFNLLGNAVKFTAAGAVALRASWSEGRARFRVEDTGPGIAREELARLFEPFVQAEAGLASREGTGLGLALSRDLARLMGGDVRAESEPGRGSAFELDVPLPATSMTPAPPEGRRVLRLAPGQGERRVLVVDDVDVNRAVISRLLSDVGFAVRGAADGEEAVAVWRAWEPHLIWMDKRMRGVDGLEATRRIREEEARQGRPRVPVLAASASALEHERGEILAAGCDDFVAKPVREEVLYAKMAQYLGIRFSYEGESEPETGAEPAAARVLLVDDDWICRQVGQELLRQAGVSVTTAASGDEALAVLDRERFDLVLLDLQMPGLGGEEVARRIPREAASRPPVVAMSADPLDGERARLVQAGFDDILAKPVEPGALDGLLRRWRVGGGLSPAGG